MSAAPALHEPAPAAVADAASFAARMGATQAEVVDLERLEALLADWNARMNLVGAATLAEFWPRHAFDSAQLLRIEPSARVWVDIGAGAGFPGLVLAILLKGRPAARVHLVESRAKRCAFLAAAVDALGLPAEVHHARAEDLAIEADVAAARAVAPLARLLGFAAPYLRRGATGLFMKGRGAEAEIAEAKRLWRFHVERIVSLSDPEGRILKVGGLSHVR
ncbi:MAG: 16S rRNA (guanine(527)-N(7))-methyltransferase RsmG [Caulobacteraceae bacterium]